MATRETVREQIANYHMELYCEAMGWEVDYWEDLTDEVRAKYLSEADHILTFRGLLIEDDDQSTPENPYEANTVGYYAFPLVCQKLKNAGFVKCLPKEEK